MSIRVRRASQADYEEIIEIYSFESVISQTSQLPYGSREFWMNFYKEKSDHSIELVVMYDNRVVGHMGILLETSPRRKHVGRFGLAVHPRYQGKGCGTALMAELINMADNWLNLTRLELEVSSENRVAIDLYEKFGFDMEGTAVDALFFRGRYLDSYHMARINSGDRTD
ncbi:MAG: GNAT family N-acetyltransferase [Desulfobacterales bacterium]|nr:GNAT family N-acetyltransferase [Desulfobacterales bacterium]